MKRITCLLFALSLAALTGCAHASTKPDFTASARPEQAPRAEAQDSRLLLATLRAQRDSNAQALQDTQLQLQLAMAEVESLKKQLADAQAKLAPKPEKKPAEKK